MRKDYQEYYRVLNLSPGATPAEIKRSYHQIIRRWHPDLFKPGSLMQKTAEDITKETNEAFEQLFKKRHYRKFPPPGEAAPPKPARPARRPPPKAPPPRRSPGKWAAQKARRAAAWPWRRFAAAAFAAGAVFAGVALRADIRGLFRAGHPAPAAAVASGAAVASTGEPAGPAGLATVSVPIAAGSAFGPEARTDNSPLSASEGRASRPRPERSRRADEPPEQVVQPGFALLRRGEPSHSEGSQGRLALPTETRAHPQTDRPVDIASLTEPYASSDASTPSAPYTPALAPPAAAPSADLNKSLDETTARLNTFGIGDSKARVLGIQGRPDEDRGSVLRYGSSLVYFSNGWVRDWVDRYPRLNIRRWPTIPLFPIGFFQLGSDRSEVIRAQGMPTQFTSYGYTYGTSFIFFDNDRVSAFGEGDLLLNGLVLPTLPNVDQLP